MDCHTIDIDPVLPPSLIARIGLFFVDSTEDAVMLSTVHRHFWPATCPWLWRHITFKNKRTPSVFESFSTFPELTVYTTDIDFIGIDLAEQIWSVVAVLGSCRRHHQVFALRVRFCAMTINGIPSPLVKRLVKGIEDVQLIHCLVSCRTLSDIVRHGEQMRNFVLFSIKLLPSFTYGIVNNPSITHCIFTPNTSLAEAMSLRWFRDVILPSPIEELSLAAFSLAGLHSISFLANTLKYLRVTLPMHNRFCIDNVPLANFTRLSALRINCIPDDFTRPSHNIARWCVAAPSLTELHFDVYGTRFDANRWHALRAALQSKQSLAVVSVHFVIIVRYQSVRFISMSTLKTLIFNTLQTNGPVTLPYSVYVKISTADHGSALEKQYMTYY